MKKIIFVILLASLLLLSGCYDIGFGHNNNKHHGGDISQTYELQADGSWKGTVDGTILKGTNAAYIAELDKAPASGGQPSNVKSISSNYAYTNTSGAAKMVIIRTTGGDLTINAPLDTVFHYGDAGTVNVIAVASASYDGHAEIATELIVKQGHIKLSNDISESIPLITVPADATGAVAIEIPEDVEIDAVAVASAQATAIAIEGSVSTITNTGTATPTIEVATTAVVDKITGDTAVTITGDGYVADDNGVEKGEAPDDFDSSPMKIFTTKGLKEIATRVNGGNNLSGKTVQLQRNINLMDEAWTPIGSKSLKNPFSGTFDGNGKTISGLSITSGDYVALFGMIKDATVKDFTVSGTVSGATNAAGAVARMDGGTLTNVTNKVNVTTGTKGGGVVCFINENTTNTLTNCINEGTISGSNTDGGLGGILGHSKKGCTVQLSSCVNNGSISDNGGDFVGGIIGHVDFGGVELSSCVNTGAITGGLSAGGIIGGNRITDGELTLIKLTSCTNSGAVSGVTAAGYAGGITGFMEGKVNMSSCKNTGAVSSAAGSGYTGGISGGFRFGTIDSSSSGGSATLSGGYIGRLIGRLSNADDLSAATLSLGTSGVGSTSEKTISVMGGFKVDQAGWVTIQSGTLFGLPTANENIAKIKFAGGSKWTQDGNTTLSFDAEKVYQAEKDTSTWSVE